MKKIIFVLLMISGTVLAQWEGASLRPDGKFRDAKNTAEFLGKGIDSVFASLVYIVNLDSISADKRIDSIKAILSRIENLDFATSEKQDTSNSLLTSIINYVNNVKSNTAVHTGAVSSLITLTSSATAAISSQSIKEIEVLVPGGVQGYWGYSSTTCDRPIVPGTFIRIEIDDPNKIYWRGSGVIRVDLKY